MQFPTLAHTILSNQSIETLCDMYKKGQIIDIEREIERRLISCDTDLTEPVINFMYKNLKDKTVRELLGSGYVKNGIYAALECIPWKIGVIYDYTDPSHHINSAAVILGKRAYKTKNGKYYKPTWLNADESKLTLREIISGHNKPINHAISVITQDPQLDNKIRDTLMENDVVTITVCLFLPPMGTVIRSFPNPLSYFEVREIYPCHITVGDFSHRLVDFPGDLNIYYPREYHLKVIHAEDYQKLLTLKQQTEEKTINS